MIQLRTNKIKVLSLILALCCVLSVPVHAATYASDQLSMCDLTPYTKAGGEIVIRFTVQGTGLMKSLGASQINVYEKVVLSSGRYTWMPVASFSEADPGMIAYDEFLFVSEQRVSGTVGGEYKVTATFFATDYEGVRDSTKATKYITA